MKMIILAALLPAGLVLATSFLINLIKSLFARKHKPDEQDNDL